MLAYSCKIILADYFYLFLIYAIEIIQAQWPYGQTALIDHINKGTPRAVRNSLEYIEHFGMRWQELEDILLKRDNFQELRQYYKAIRYGLYASLSTK